jgi:hypothetical protein
LFWGLLLVSRLTLVLSTSHFSLCKRYCYSGWLLNLQLHNLFVFGFEGFFCGEGTGVELRVSSLLGRHPTTCAISPGKLFSFIFCHYYPQISKWYHIGLNLSLHISKFNTDLAVLYIMKFKQFSTCLLNLT